ncbi:MAG: hypothetical protein R6V01_08990 [Thermoplasmatota archaeon]
MAGEGKKKRESMRRTAGISSMVVGIPNFVVAAVMCFGGIALTILLGILAYELFTGDSGEGPLGPVCVALVLVIVIVGLIVAVIATVLALIFALAMGGQSLGGYYALKGKNFGRAVTLTFIGTGVSFLFGAGLLLYGVFGDGWGWPRIVALVWGAYDLFASVVSLVAGILMIKAKDTFSKPGKKKGKKKKGKKK